MTKSKKKSSKKQKKKQTISNDIKSVIYIFAIFILLLIANSAFIWKITIKGNYSYTAEQMIDYVHKKGVKEGVLKESIDTESLEKSIRKNFGDISWVCVEEKAQI